jgi:hypothetical protein
MESLEISNARGDILSAGANNTSAVLQQGSANAQSLLQAACGGTASVIAATERQSFHTQAGDDRNSNAQASQAAGEFFESRGLIQGGAAENREATNVNHVESRQLNNSNFFELRNSIANGFTANLLAAKDAQIAIMQSEGSIKHQVSDFAGLLTNQLIHTKESLVSLVGNLAIQNQLELSKYFAISEREMNKQFGLATLAASQNAAKIEADVEKCCCEIKEVVNCTAGETQAFVQAAEANRVKDELIRAQSENVVLQIQ